MVKAAATGTGKAADGRDPEGGPDADDRAERTGHERARRAGADRERHRAQLPAGRHVQQRGHRDQSQQPRAAEIGRDRRDPAVAEPAARAPACRAKSKLGSQLATVRKPIWAASAGGARMRCRSSSLSALLPRIGWIIGPVGCRAWASGSAPGTRASRSGKHCWAIAGSGSGPGSSWCKACGRSRSPLHTAGPSGR